jgi:zona occludens toxin (predicted ATPase)
MAWIQFFSQHRKYGYCVVLVAQFDKMIDRQFRALIEYEYIHRKVSNFGVVGWLLSLGCLGKLHVSINRYYPLNQKIGTSWFVARKRTFEMYDSYGDFERLGADSGQFAQG